MIDNQVVSRIAQKIRSTRLQKNLTIQELATRTHVSKGLLSKIENSKTIPSLPVFVTLIHSLEISLKEFFHDMVLVNGKRYFIVKKNQHSPVARDKVPGMDYQFILSQNITNCMMEAGVMTLQPGSRIKPAALQGYEFYFLLAGSCEYQFGDQRFLLEEGDSLYLDSSVIHGPIPLSNEKAVMLSIHFILPG